jgi:hypothetical protein
MPKLKETYKQIQERNAREIKQRTRDKLKALQEERELVFVEDSSSDFVEDLIDSPSIVKEQSYTVHTLASIIVLLVLVCLLLCQHIYLAKRK